MDINAFLLLHQDEVNIFPGYLVIDLYIKQFSHKYFPYTGDIHFKSVS